MDIPAKDELIQRLVDEGCLKFGEVTLKSGLKSPFYINLREITMNRPLRRGIVHLICSIIEKIPTARSRAIVGVPYGVVPVAVYAASNLDCEYYPLRKEDKGYGLKQDLSKADDQFEYIVIEDVMSTGSSIVETLQKLEGKTVTDIIVIVDREQGGEELLRAKYPAIKLHSIFKARDILDASEQDQRI